MARSKKASLITNLCIAVVLFGLGFAVFTADLANVFISVSAPVSNGKPERISVLFAVEENTSYEDLDVLLKRLEVTKTPATFFVAGVWATKTANRDLVKIMAEKFEIGNMGFSGKALAKKSEKDQYAEIYNCHKLIKSITSEADFSKTNGGVSAEVGEPYEMSLFMPPQGSFDKKTLKCAQKMGYKAVMWSTESVENVHGGDFILLKVNLSTSAWYPISNKLSAFKIAKVSENLL